MKSCPVCDFLMADDELLCATCSEQLESSGAMATPDRARFDLDAGESAATSAVATGGVATAVLERPTSPGPLPEQVRYRSRDGRRRAGRVVLGLVALGAVVGGLAVLGVRGEGPLAEPLVSWGLVAPPVVEVPDVWTTERSEAGSFRAVVPAGAEALDGPFDPEDPSKGALAGYAAPLGDEGNLLVIATDFGRGPDAMRAADDVAFGELVTGFANLLSLGEASVVRSVPVADGRAVDAVFIDEEVERTTRARFHLGNGRFHALVTAGPDAGSRALDEAHARLVGGFELQR